MNYFKDILRKIKRKRSILEKDLKEFIFQLAQFGWWHGDNIISGLY
jgi:hypothetical protein